MLSELSRVQGSYHACNPFPSGASAAAETPPPFHFRPCEVNVRRRCKDRGSVKKEAQAGAWESWQSPLKSYRALFLASNNTLSESGSHPKPLNP